MFFVHIVQRVEHRHRDFRLPRVAGRRLLLPEAICAAQVQKVVAADAFVGWREATKRRELRESNIDWIGGSSHVIERYFATQPVLPVSSQSDVPLKPRRAPSRATCECLADLFIRIIGESAEPASRKKLKAGLSTINVRLSAVDETRWRRRIRGSLDNVGEVIEKQICSGSQSVFQIPALIACLVRDDLFGTQVL